MVIFTMAAPTSDNPLESLSGAVERVTFHSEETGFCVLRVKALGHRDLVTVVGTAASKARKIRGGIDYQLNS